LILIVDRFQETVLHVAAKHSNAKVLRLLLDSKADLDAKDKDGKSALDVLPKHKVNCRALLISTGANPQQLEKFKGDHEAMEIDDGYNLVRFHSFSSVRSWLMCPRGKKGYYEIEIVDEGHTYQWGFCSPVWESNNRYTGMGVGDDKQSWGVDGDRVQKWSNGCVGFGTVWSKGDVIGLACDLLQLQISVSVNGDFSAPNGLAFELPDDLDGLHPAFTSGNGLVKVNLGDKPFRYKPPDNTYESFEDMKGVSRALFNCIDYEADEGPTRFEDDGQEQRTLKPGDVVINPILAYVQYLFECIFFHTA
jgi:hypothetical protein